MTDIRLDLSIPALSFGAGPFHFDPVASLLGCPLEELLSSLMVAPAFQTTGRNGGRVEVYPLALPDGEGAMLPLGAVGRVAFHNRAGALVLQVPAPVHELVLGRVAELLLEAPRRLGTGHGSTVEFVLELRPGLGCRLPLGGLGELSIECV